MMGRAVTSAVWSADDTRRRRRRPDDDHDHDQEVNDDDLHRTLDELHRTTAWTWTETVTESYETDRFLASLQSPAHQSLFVIQHALQSAAEAWAAEKGDEGGKEDDDDAWTGVTAERILSMHCQHLLKPGRRFVVNGGNWKAPGSSSACPSNDSNDNNDCRLLLAPGLNYTIRGDDEEVPGGWRAIAVACGSDSSLSFAPGNKKSRSVSIAESIVEVASSGGRPACATKAKMAGRAAGGATPKTTTTTAATTAETAAATTNRATTTKAGALLCHALLRSLYEHLHRTLGTDLRNGTSADVALLLSMVDLPDPPADHDDEDDDRGTKDHAQRTTTAKPGRSSYGLVNSILGILCHVAALELRRGKNKKARRAADILRTVERLAAAGCERSGGGLALCPHYEMALREAAVSLPGSRGYHDGLAVVCTASSSRRLDLTLSSPRSLLCLWRRMKPFHKATVEATAPSSSSPIDVGGPATTTDLLQPRLSPILRFDDPTLPLVVDVGCGLGVALIGLAAIGCDGCLATTTAATTSTTAPNGSGSSPSLLLLRRLDWSRCNYLGADLSMEAVRWATSLAGRWQLGGRCQFCHASAETLLEYLLCLQRRSEAAGGGKGRVRIALMMLQFPTPYRLAQLLPPPPSTSPAGDNANSRCCDDTAADGGGGANNVTTGSDSCVSRTGKSGSSSSTAVAGGCNETLPLGPDDDSFMANPRILRRMAELLSPTGDDDGNANDDDDDDDDAGPSLLLVQSNCEDVALHIHDSLLATGAAAAAAATTPPSASGEIGDDAFVGTIEAVPCDKPRLSMRVGDGDDCDDDDDGAGGVTPRPTARTLAWLQQQSHQMVHDLATAADAAEIGTATATTASTGGPPTASATTLPRRAVGPGWSADPLLPVWTETEASCHHQKTPIHRCLFRRKR